MCTLTYVPIENFGKVITTNRDESPVRNSSNLSSYFTNGGSEFLIAKEPLKGGTNFAVDKKNKTAVLLNGAFEPHEFGQIYKKSRGLVMLESLESQDLFDFARSYNFGGIEPFTLVHIDDEIKEIRWDGNKLWREGFDPNIPKIWSSAQLYSAETIFKRRTWFESILFDKISEEELLNFHFTGGDGDLENDLVMNRNNLVQTVSISQVLRKPVENWVKHFNLISQEEQSISFF